jgi:hypothetical protein
MELFILPIGLFLIVAGVTGSSFNIVGLGKLDGPLRSIPGRFFSVCIGFLLFFFAIGLQQANKAPTLPSAMQERDSESKPIKPESPFCGPWQLCEPIVPTSQPSKTSIRPIGIYKGSSTPE